MSSLETCHIDQFPLDAESLKRIWAEAHRTGRQDDFHVFHLGWPEISARFNAVGRFGGVSEVASRIAGQLGAEGNSAAFREFAWRFVNIVTRALVAFSQRPDYSLIRRYVTNIGELNQRYVEHLVIISAGVAQQNREWQQCAEGEGSAA